MMARRTVLVLLGLVVFLGIANKSYGIGRVCKWKLQTGVCLPYDECFGRSKSLWDSCGRNVCCLDPIIARKKCIQHTNTIFGWSKNCPLMDPIQSRVIGGEEALPKEFPHMVAIGFEESNSQDIQWHCGGTLISPSFIMTAAHCLIKPKWSTWILAGAVHLKDSNAELRQPEQIFTHPKYSKYLFKYDIALVKVEEPFPLSESIVPACIMFEHELTNISTAIAAGWGKLEEENEKGIDYLQKVEQDVIELNECKQYHPTIVKYGGFLPSMLCAGYIPGGKDTCQGDSGGPLFVKMPKRCTYGIIGVLSSGSGCGWANSPALYTRVSYFSSWISNIIWT